MKTIIAAENQLEELATLVIAEASKKPIILLKGNLGAGKTTLTKYILKALGVTEPVTSPTFNIVSTYETEKGLSINHFDLYRIKTIDELFEIGFEEYLDSGNYCLIEWPEIAEPLYPVEVLRVSIHSGENDRTYNIE